MFDMGLGVSLDGITGVMDYETIEMLEKSSVSTFEWSPWCFWTDYDGEIRTAFIKMLERSGKKVISYHVPFKQADDIADPDETIRLRAMSRLRAHIHEASRLNAKLLIIHPSTEPIDQTKRDLYIANLRRSMLEIEGELILNDMKIALEFLPRLCMGNTLDDMNKMLDNMSDRFGVCFDINHIMDQYPQIPAIIRALGKRLFTLHICDYDGVDERHWLPFKGVIDFKAVLAALNEINYTGPFNYETSRFNAPANECLTAIEENYKEMRKLL